MSLSLISFGLMLISLGAGAERPVPIGLDAYRHWDSWPMQRIGVRAYMRSTYDRTGGNRFADASHFLYQESDEFNVTLDVEGRGCLYFARYNHWHGSPWHYEVDGTNHIVKETSTADPDNPVEGSIFLPEHLFPNPLTWTWSITKGADLMWVPLEFERSFRMAYTRTRYGTGYYIYHLYPEGLNLSRPIQAWDGTKAPDADVLDLLNRAGTDIAPKDISTETGRAEFKEGTTVLARLEGPSVLRALKLTAPRETAVAFGRARLRITWDNRDAPSIDAPVALFFGSGTLYNREDSEYLMKALPVNIRFDEDRVHLACYFPMPFFQSARIELIGAEGLGDIHWELRYAPYTGSPSEAGYFHATYRDHGIPELGRDLVFLNTRGIEGSEEWTGAFVGTSFIFTKDANLHTLEGDPRFFFDDSMTPQAYGTGTEEWGGGGDYWGGRTMTLPLAGHPCGAPKREEAHNEEDLIHSAYRFLLADLMPFGRNARIHFEHGAINQMEEEYESVTYWYGLPGASLVLTDTLDVGDAASEAAHAYVSPQATEPETLRSRYEWGTDRIRRNYLKQPWRVATDYADFTFDADAGKVYYLWLRGRSLTSGRDPDTVWVQFNEDIGTPRWAASYAHPQGLGRWTEGEDGTKYGWSSESPGGKVLAVTFAKDGRQRLRLQPRQGRHHIDQIVLSARWKEAPDSAAPATAVPGQRDEIVLDARYAEVHGGVSAVADPEASCGAALAMDHAELSGFVPVFEKTGRHTTGTSEFTVQLRPDNLGVLLRRTLDYRFPNQRAEVYVGNPSGDPDWQQAGIWYLAGSNTCVYSNPPEELGATRHEVVISDRRLRDDEFVIGPKWTAGRDSMRVKVVFTPVERPLFPGHPMPELAWSELEYQVYCFVKPTA